MHGRALSEHGFTTGVAVARYHFEHSVGAGIYQILNWMKFKI